VNEESIGKDMTSRRYYLSFFDWFTRAGAVVVAAVGAAVICGWILDIALLKSVAPGLASMKLNAACAFLAAGVALWLLHTSAPGSQAIGIARALVVFVAVLGGLSLAEYLFGLEFGIDQLLIVDSQGAIGATPPGRMSPATALNFLIVGLALLALKARQPRLAACTHWLVIPPLFVSTLAIVGYAYGVSSLYAVGQYVSMAAHTAFSFFVLGISVLAADPAHGVARIASSDTAGGIVVRWLLPTLPIVLFALGWLRLAGQQAGLYDTRFGLALMVLLSITVCIVAVVSTAVTLHRVDITRKRAEAEIMALNADLEQRVEERTRELARLSAELRLFADNVPVITVSWDENLRCRFANKAFAAVFGLTVGDVIGKHLRELYGAEVYREVEGHFVRALRGNPVTYQRTHKLANGESRFLEVKLLPHIGDQGEALGCFAVTTDITDHKLAEARIQRVAHHDSLTGLPNRSLFNDRLNQAISLAKRDSRKFALLYLDLDRFKAVNDTLGHSAGDALLTSAAARIREQVRESDTVARVGGDEFAVILPGVLRREEAEIVARKIIAALVIPFRLDGQKQSVEIGTSIGIALYPADASDPDALVTAADAAMYSAKRVGDSYRFCVA
jgi:diguanylate cyclase (GGDEF)-like protein/PAS domain S-box-containing protein